MGVGDRNGCSTTGVVDADKVSLSCASTVIIVAVVSVVVFEPFPDGVGSSGWGTGVRVEDTASNSAGLGEEVGKTGGRGRVRIVGELGVVDASVDLRDVGWSIGQGFPEDNTGNELEGLTEVGVALINEAGGQSGRGPSGGILSLFAPFFLSLRDPGLSFFRKAFIFLATRAGVRRGSSQGEFQGASAELSTGRAVAATKRRSAPSTGGAPNYGTSHPHGVGSVNPGDRTKNAGLRGARHASR